MNIWHLLQSLHIGLWVYALYSALSVPKPESWILIGTILVIHLLQFIFISDNIGRQKTYSRGQSFIMTILLGFSWWYPLKQNKKSWF